MITVGENFSIMASIGCGEKEIVSYVLVGI